MKVIGIILIWLPLSAYACALDHAGTKGQWIKSIKNGMLGGAALLIGIGVFIGGAWLLSGYGQ